MERLITYTSPKKLKDDVCFTDTPDWPQRHKQPPGAGSSKFITLNKTRKTFYIQNCVLSTVIVKNSKQMFTMDDNRNKNVRKRAESDNQESRLSNSKAIPWRAKYKAGCKSISRNVEHCHGHTRCLYFWPYKTLTPWDGEMYNVTLTSCEAVLTLRNNNIDARATASRTRLRKRSC